MSIIYVVGLGAGSRDGMTSQAQAALTNADVIAGYKTYVDLVSPFFPDKKIFSTGMMQERERCLAVLDMAKKGTSVALVCSGDAGVYGMASLVLELASKDTASDAVEILVVPGVTAALSGAALLGAPLSHDFCVISLSNLLTPQPLIEKRLRAATLGGFAIALYNPRSHHRPDTLRNACAILLETLPADTPCGWARNIGREGEESHICTLSELAEAELDMFCTAFIGNSSTRVLLSGGTKRLVTPRGYTLESEAPARPEASL
ncbi:MAG: precorrin-3B C(17)-methyltransferase [Treponema sp.]|nr:precorrin-3B C(17)-methyltransferase [Treponema sp.]